MGDTSNHFARLSSIVVHQTTKSFRHDEVKVLFSLGPLVVHSLSLTERFPSITYFFSRSCRIFSGVMGKSMHR